MMVTNFSVAATKSWESSNLCFSKGRRHLFLTLWKNVSHVQTITDWSQVSDFCWRLSHLWWDCWSQCNIDGGAFSSVMQFSNQSPTTTYFYPLVPVYGRSQKIMSETYSAEEIAFKLLLVFRQYPSINQYICQVYVIGEWYHFTNPEPNQSDFENFSLSLWSCHS